MVFERYFYPCRYGEVANYDFDNPPKTREEFRNKTIGHFTQVCLSAWVFVCLFIVPNSFIRFAAMILRFYENVNVTLEN